MKSFFQNLTFSRTIILASFLGSAVLGYLLHKEKARLEAYEDAIPYADEIVPKIVSRSEELEELMKAAASADFAGGSSGMETYVRNKATDENVHVGQVNTGRGKEIAIATGGAGGQGSRVIDTVYRITPSKDGQGEYTRSEISNFAFLLEQDRGGLAVTRLLLRPTQKGYKKDQVVEDRWTFEIDVSVRSREEG